MSEPLSARYAQAVLATLGHPGRLISFSKSGYRERHPAHVAIFNANVCIDTSKLWHGDLDLTLDEPKLAALSRQTGEIAYVLYERDARFDQKQPLLGEAVYSVTPTGHTAYQYAWFERTKDGQLQRRPPEPDTRPRWNWQVVWHRPRLLHFWRIERRTTAEHLPSSLEHSTLVYVGARDSGRTPLLVLGLFRTTGLGALGFEWTYYPTHVPPHHAARPLLSLQPVVGLGRLRLFLTLIAWPGYAWELRAGYAIKERWR